MVAGSGGKTVDIKLVVSQIAVTSQAQKELEEAVKVRGEVIEQFGDKSPEAVAANQKVVDKLEELQKAQKQSAEAVKELKDQLTASKESVRNMEVRSNWDKSLYDMMKQRSGMQDEDYDAKTSQRTKSLQMLSNLSAQIAGTLKGFMTQSIGVLMDIYNRLKAASPLLQAIESLFNLAMQLFFMPLGNKLAEVMLPAVLELLDKVVSIWDAFEGKSLGDMFSYAITKGVEFLSSFFITIGDELAGQTGIVGSMGRMLQTIGRLIESSGAKLIELVVGLSGFVLTHLPEFIGLFIGFTAMHYALMIALIATTASQTPWSAVAGATAASVAVGTVSALAIKGVTGMAEGGMVPATPGGQLRILGEGGENEYVIPESKMENFNNTGATTNNFYITGVTSQELGDMIDDRVNRQISGSRLRGVF